MLSGILNSTLDFLQFRITDFFWCYPVVAPAEVMGKKMTFYKVHGYHY